METGATEAPVVDSDCEITDTSLHPPPPPQKTNNQHNHSPS